MSGYAPSMTDVRSGYAAYRVDHSYGGVATMASASAEYDRAITAHDASVRRAEEERVYHYRVPTVVANARKAARDMPDDIHDPRHMADWLRARAALGDAPTGGK